MSQLVRPIYGPSDIPSRDDSSEAELFKMLESPDFKRVINFAILNKIRQSKNAIDDREALAKLHEAQCLTEIIDLPSMLLGDNASPQEAQDEKTLNELGSL